MAGENSKPNRLIAGQQTRLSRTMHDVRYDPVHDELLVTNPFSRAILVFRGGADGEEAPIRIIQGANTKLRGSDRLDVDPVHNEIYVPNGNDILVFPREGRGNIAPARVITGPEITSDDVGTLAVDPVNHVFVAAKDIVRAGSNQRSRLLIYERTASGESRPVRIIEGPKTEILRINQLQVYPPKGRIIAAMPGAYDMQEPEGVFIGIWNITDHGDIPPRWKIAGPGSTMMKPRGVAINPKDKEILVGDMRLNAVLTYYFPEMF